MKWTYLTGPGEEYRVNWFQYHIGSKAIRFTAWIFRMNIAIGHIPHWYGKPRPETETGDS